MAKKHVTPVTRKKAGPPAWVEPFLAHLAQTANVRASALAAGIPRMTAYRHRNRSGDFAARWDAAIEDAVDDLELEARRRAFGGLRRVKFHNGSPIQVPALDAQGHPVMRPGENGAGPEPVLVPYVEHEYSDTLMIFLLKAHRPEKYRERYEHTGAGGSSLFPPAQVYLPANGRDPAPNGPAGKLPGQPG